MDSSENLPARSLQRQHSLLREEKGEECVPEGKREQYVEVGDDDEGEEQEAKDLDLELEPIVSHTPSLASSATNLAEQAREFHSGFAEIKQGKKKSTTSSRPDKRII